jgi:hypothetical protein
MDEECEGSGREVPGDPPPDEAATCPVCGRETRVQTHAADSGSTFTIAHHRRVVRESG